MNKLLLALPLAAALVCCENAPDPYVEILSPEDQDLLTANVHVSLAATWHDVFLVIDEPCVSAGHQVTSASSRLPLFGVTEVDLTLKVGPHDLCAQVVDAHGDATEASDEVHVEVAKRYEPHVEIVSPYDGAAESSTFTVNLDADDITIAPIGLPADDEAHLYLVVDGACPLDRGAYRSGDIVEELVHGERSVELTLERGTHTLCAGLADNAGRVLPFRSRSQSVYVSY